MHKQIIIARKDLNMSPGKLAAQISHASMAFLTSEIRDLSFPIWKYDCNDIIGYKFEYVFDKDLYEQWINGSFTKCVLEAKNKNHLMKAIDMASALGMKKHEDYFIIADNCYTELTPEFIDEDGVGRCITCIGFKPMDSEVIDKIGKKYHLYV